MRCWIYMIHIYFNPRSREGSDRAEELAYYEQRIFQSALPRGERPDPLSRHFPARDFNPRSREGSDGYKGASSANDSISIRAPARGATHAPQSYRPVSSISIRAPARGATAVTI